MRLTSSDAWMLGSGMVALLIAALMVNALVPQFSDLYTAFGADLPSLTSFFVEHRHGLLLLPALVPVSWIVLARFSVATPGQRAVNNPAFAALVFAIGIAVLLVPLTIFAMYLPIFRMAAIVDG